MKHDHFQCKWNATFFRCFLLLFFFERTSSTKFCFCFFQSHFIFHHFGKTIDLFISGSVVLSCAFHFKFHIWPSCVLWWNVTNMNAHCSRNNTLTKNERIDCWKCLCQKSRIVDQRHKKHTKQRQKQKMLMKCDLKF